MEEILTGIVISSKDYKEKDISATYNDGVLTITLPKLEENKKVNEPTKIEIK